jgi:hypothetical protein
MALPAVRAGCPVLYFPQPVAAEGGAVETRVQLVTRERRRQELLSLPDEPGGLNQLCGLYESYFRVTPGHVPLTAQVMVARILSVEFPET